MISKLFLPPLSNREDSYGPSCTRIPARGLSPACSGEASASLLVPGSRLPTQKVWPSTAGSPDSLCRAAQTIAPPVDSPPLPCREEGQHLQMSRPWREVKSRRGAPKRINTEGFACPNPQCRYFGNTDAQIHALVGDGKHGQAEQIQTLRCQACRTTFTRQAEYALVPAENPFPCRVAVVLSALAEGLDPSAASRIAGLSTSHDHHLVDSRGLARPGPARVLLPPSLAPGCIPLFTSDGLNLYFYALTAHFGQWLQVGHRGRKALRWQVAAGLIYGQVKKS
jgi:hypothetical protein